MLLFTKITFKIIVLAETALEQLLSIYVGILSEWTFHVPISLSVDNNRTYEVT